MTKIRGFSDRPSLKPFINQRIATSYPQLNTESNTYLTQKTRRRPPVNNSQAPENIATRLRLRESESRLWRDALAAICALRARAAQGKAPTHQRSGLFVALSSNRAASPSLIPECFGNLATRGGCSPCSATPARGSAPASGALAPEPRTPPNGIRR